jgi:hypothetical protein
MLPHHPERDRTIGLRKQLTTKSLRLLSEIAKCATACGTFGPYLTSTNGAD